MKPLKFKRVEIRRPRYDPNPHKSVTNNSGWRVGLFIVFEDYDGEEFDYMPKWKEVEELNKRRVEVEKVNKELAKQHIKTS